MRKGVSLTLVILSILFSCTKLEDASPTERDTFIHFYEKSTNYFGAIADQTTDGYIVAGNLEGELDFKSIITKTDQKGNVVWETIIPSSSVSALKVLSDGYLILGDSIEVDPLAEQVTDILKTKARLMKLDASGSIVQDFSWSSSQNAVYFHGNALTVDALGNIITVGEINTFNSPVRSFVSAHDPNTFSLLWTQIYGYVNRDFINSKNVHFTSTQKIVWASAALDDQSNSKSSYLSVPFVSPNSTFVNAGLFGQNEDLFYSAEDIQPSGTGFGIIGTFSNILSQNQNIYFVRTDPAGGVIPNSVKYFDGVLSANNSALSNSIESASEDTGSAIVSTSDGGFLLVGTMATTTARGNGGKDILLLRLDAFGNLIWNKTLGGIGDDIANSVKITSDGGFLICGSATLGGLSAAMIIKTDKNGSLEN